jgi:ERCC4-type nuclease
MIILQDHREKIGKHNNVEQYFDKQGIVRHRCRLEVGDYMFPNGKVSVDLKSGGLEELANDLYRDKKDLNKKYKKCFHNGIKLIVLIEEDINSMEELLEWKSKHSKINGRFLVYLIHTLQISYGIRFIFCNPQDTGAKILELLKE